MSANGIRRSLATQSGRPTKVLVDTTWRMWFASTNQLGGLPGSESQTADAVNARGIGDHARLVERGLRDSPTGAR